MTSEDFLFEIGTEELPAKQLKTLATSLLDNICQQLKKIELSYSEAYCYTTPRRIAIYIKDLQTKQPDRNQERKGPAVQAGFDAQGQPTPALQGFARSCNTTIEQLEKLDTSQGAWFIYRFQEAGKTVFELMPELLTQAFKNLSMPKPMFWADKITPFIRPVQWLVALYGSEVIPLRLFDLQSDNITYGHRFHAPEKITLNHAQDYLELLKKKGHVLVDFNERQQLIKQQINAIATGQKGKAIIHEDLLDEVTGLVEWPTALLIPFDEKFLSVPREALTAAMIDHQKCFPIENLNNELIPYFITISNIESNKPQEVIQGNERVMRARLSDAQFFYVTDCKQTLRERLPLLKQIIFQAQLGSLYDKAERIAKLNEYICKQFKSTESTNAKNAGMLCKVDLITNMVGEFPELQGIMGSYYAKNDGEPEAVSIAIREHYLPRFASDELPQSFLGACVAIADRIDSLIGIFGINQLPTGEKDPFGLRRAALSIIRILINNKLSLNLVELLQQAKNNYQVALKNSDAISQTHAFILERLRTWYQEQNISADTLAAVLAVQNQEPFDIHQRVHAVQIFRKLPEAERLAAANKRVTNLLTKASDFNLPKQNIFSEINTSIFIHPMENELYEALQTKQHHFEKDKQDYTAKLTDLASLGVPVNHFFDAVLVMDENQQIQFNRLKLLAALRELFLTVADISVLQG